MTGRVRAARTEMRGLEIDLCLCDERARCDRSMHQKRANPPAKHAARIPMAGRAGRCAYSEECGARKQIEVRTHHCAVAAVSRNRRGPLVSRGAYLVSSCRAVRIHI